MEALLAPFADAAVPSGSRFVDVPPDVAARVLDAVDPALADGRPNGDQPSMRWLVDVARELDGRLAGSLSWGDLRFDAVQVQGRPAWSALLERLACDWPSEATTGAVAELWSGWDAVRPYWAGHAGEALAAARSDGGVLGLWWD
ncbi:hypothetical protein [Cellulomonas sp. IC4_254]|uniref:hypothetical protein n=1 Tax=Cellulomonas sp. IC4_254 TaxID=2714040 RepID=UPI001423328B|nr:hypothetical protein [Cellulomonas sp. IC4_254]NHT16126.1 hypothetical protein [Cellulomonas sp. IC4_254]